MSHPQTERRALLERATRRGRGIATTGRTDAPGNTDTESLALRAAALAGASQTLAETGTASTTLGATIQVARCTRAHG
jgi:hypothetical protein